MSEITLEDIYSWLGENLGDSCPKCDSIVWTDKHGLKWCDSDKCTWSNDPDFEKQTKKFLGIRE